MLHSGPNVQFVISCVENYADAGEMLPLFVLRCVVCFYYKIWGG